MLLVGQRGASHVDVSHAWFARTLAIWCQTGHGIISHIMLVKTSCRIAMGLSLQAAMCGCGARLSKPWQAAAGCKPFRGCCFQAVDSCNEHASSNGAFFQSSRWHVIIGSALLCIFAICFVMQRICRHVATCLGQSGVACLGQSGCRS